MPEERASEADRSTDEALMKAAAETKRQLQKMEKERESTVLCMKMVKDEYVSTREADEAVQGPLDMVAKCEASRATVSNDVVDDVALPLQAHSTQIQVTRTYYSQLIGALANMEGKLQDVLLRIDLDVQQKRRTVQLDKEALAMGHGGSSKASGYQVDNSKAKLTRGGYNSQNDALLRECATIRYEAARLCKKATTVREERAAIEMECATAVVEACGVHRAKTEAIRRELEVQLRQVRSKLHRAQKKKSEMEREIGAREGPLRLARERLAHREQRPPQEAVRDGGEEALEAEVKKNTDGLAELKLRHHLTSADIEDLTQAKEDLKSRLAGKANASYQDHECVRLQREIYPATDDPEAVAEATEATPEPSTAAGSSAREPRPPPTAAGRGSRAMQSSRLGSTLGSLRSYVSTGPTYESQFIAEGINPPRHCKPPSTARSSRRLAGAYENDLGGTQSSLEPQAGPKKAASRPATGRPGTGRTPLTPRGRQNLSELARVHTPEVRPQTSRPLRQAGGATKQARRDQAFNTNMLKEWRQVRDAGQPALDIARKQQMYGPLTTRTPPVSKLVSKKRVLASAGRPKQVSRGPWQAQAPLVVFD